MVLNFRQLSEKRAAYSTLGIPPVFLMHFTSNLSLQEFEKYQIINLDSLKRRKADSKTGQNDRVEKFGKSRICKNHKLG